MIPVDDQISGDEDDEFSAGDIRRLIDVSPLEELISEAAVCRECRVGDLHLTETKRSGSTSHVSLTFSECGQENSSVLSKKSGKFYEINRQAVMASHYIGKGKQGLTTFLTCIISTPKTSSNSAFEGHCTTLHKVAKDVATSCMDNAAACLSGDSTASGDNDGFKDVAVTVDGALMRHGFSSM